MLDHDAQLSTMNSMSLTSQGAGASLPRDKCLG
jgi:hypothetical protein